MATVNYDAYRVKQESFRALRDDVIVEEMEFGERTLSSGIIMPVSYTHLTLPTKA